MRQNAVSSAPQKDEPIHRELTSAMIPTVVEACSSRRTPSVMRGLGRVGEDPLHVGDQRRRQLGRAQHARGHEQDDQREREDRQQQAVGHHRRKAGQVVLIGLAPEGGDGTGRAVHTARIPCRGVSTLDVGAVAVLRRQHLGHAEAEFLVDHDDLSARDRLAVDQQVNRLAGEPVERHDRARAERERLPDGHLRAPDLDRQLHRHVVQAGELLGRDGTRSLRLDGAGRGGLEGCVVDSFSHGLVTGR